MRTIFLLLFLMSFVTRCKGQRSTQQITVADYYAATDSADFTEIKELINDSITIISGDYIMPYSRDSFYKVFQWDSIFRTSYELIALKEDENQVVADVTLQSARLQFLKNNPMTCSYRISFESGKISKIEELECVDANWTIWRKKVDSLVDWIAKYHPELDGFIHDMTMHGAIKYTKAIDLYKATKKIH